MKESYRKSLAHYPGPESCGVRRKAAIEALTGGHAGRVLSCEIRDIWVLTASPSPAAISPSALWRAEGGPGAVEAPERAWKLHAREPGDPRDAHGGPSRGPVGEGDEP
jgi:hypothetical protein